MSSSHHHSESCSDDRRRPRRRRDENCFAFDSRRNTFGSENITVVGTIPPNRIELARVFVPCRGVVKLDGVVGWQATVDASSSDRVPLLFEIFRNVVDGTNPIFSTLDSAAVIDSTDVGARFVTTAFTTVDARFPFADGFGNGPVEGLGIDGLANIPGFPFERGTTYILTVRALEPGDTAIITGPVVLEANVERRRRESSSDHHHRRRPHRHHHHHRRHRCHHHRKPCKCVCTSKVRKTVVKTKRTTRKRCGC